jgi:hypothetical protein
MLMLAGIVILSAVIGLVTAVELGRWRERRQTAAVERQARALRGAGVSATRRLSPAPRKAA